MRFIYANLADVENVPAPTNFWRWDDVVGAGIDDVTPSIAHRLRDRGLIERVDDGFWRATSELERLVEKYGGCLAERGQSGLTSVEFHDRDSVFYNGVLPANRSQYDIYSRSL